MNRKYTTTTSDTQPYGSPDGFHVSSPRYNRFQCDHSHHIGRQGHGTCFRPIYTTIHCKDGAGLHTPVLVFCQFHSPAPTETDVFVD